MARLSANGKWYRVSLRLMGDGLPIDDVESMLGLIASSVGRKGEHLRGDPRYAKLQTHVWVSKYLTDSDVPFEQQMTILLDALEPNLHALKKILQLPNVEGELFLGFGSSSGQGGATFPPELLRRVAEFGLTLSLDLYPLNDTGPEETS